VRLRLLSDRLAICRLDPANPAPSWPSGSFVSITRTATELSIVCAESAIPEGVTASTGWRALQVEGVLDFSLTGVLSSLAQPLAAAGISIFSVSTYDTDTILVRDADRAKAVDALAAAGHSIAGAS